VRVLTFRAEVRPAPQGSKGFDANGNLREASRFLKAFRNRVKLAAMRARAARKDGWAPVEGPCIAHVIFYIQRPKETAFPYAPAGPPDLDKLARALNDALTAAGVWRDDSRLVEYGILKKVWADEYPPGVFVMVTELDKLDNS
jgi:Holliday junction resolvase RusA-like endonuclease